MTDESECKHENFTLAKLEPRTNCGWERRTYKCDNCNYEIKDSVKGDNWIAFNGKSEGLF